MSDSCVADSVILLAYIPADMQSICGSFSPLSSLVAAELFDWHLPLQ